MTSGKINIYYYPVEKGEANQGLVLILFARRNIHERNKNQGIKSGADEASGRSNAEHIEGINENYICMLKLCNNEFSVWFISERFSVRMISWNACTAMIKEDVNNKNVPFKKRE